MILKLSVNNQSVESSGITKDYKDALCEYVWNSFEANATAVAIDCIPNELTGSAEIVITDNGDGIAYDSLECTFGAFLDSQKNSLERKYLIFHKSGAVISATRGDLPELMLSAGKIDLCGELYHNGEPLNL